MWHDFSSSPTGILHVLFASLILSFYQISSLISDQYQLWVSLVVVISTVVERGIINGILEDLTKGKTGVMQVFTHA